MPNVLFENHEKYGIIKIIGEVNILNNNELKNVFNEAFNLDQYKIIIDFSQTTYIDSSAISVIISARNNIIAKNGTILFCNLPQTIEKIFSIIGFKGIITFCQNLNEAIKIIESK